MDRLVFAKEQIQLKNQYQVQIMQRQKIKVVIDKHQTGCNQGQQHSQKVLTFHFPVKSGHRHYHSSGVTIGPGIDLGNRSPTQVKKLFQGTVSPQELQLLKGATKLKGKQAEDWVTKHKGQIKLSQATFDTVFNRELDEKEKTMNRIFSSDKFKQKYKVDGTKLLNQMQSKYKIVMYDLLYLGRNSPKTRETIIPQLVKIHKNQATAADIASLNKNIVHLYNGHKERAKDITNILNNGMQQTKAVNQLNKQNLYIKSIVKDLSSQQISNVLYNKFQGKIGGVDLAYDLSSIRINGFSLTDSIIKIHLQEGENPYLKDFIVPLKVYYDENIQYKNLSISIDPADPYNPDGPLYQKVYYPKEMEGTYFAQIMVEADYLMKQLILGVDEKGKPFRYPQSLKKVGLAFEDQIQYIDTLNERTRQWIVIKKVHFIQKDTNQIKIGDIQMGLEARVQHIGSEGRLADAQHELSTHIKKFCELFTQHYNLLAEEYEAFRIIKRLSKAAILAKLMVQKRCNINFKLIDQLFEKEKTDKSSKIVPKLSNELMLSYQQLPLMKYKEQVKIKLSLAGGCDLNYKQDMATIDSQPNLAEQVQKSYLPFLFQSYIECEEQSCQNVCSNELDAMDDTKCIDHTEKICRICWYLIRQGEKFTQLRDGRQVHNQCLHCQACYGYITGSYTEYQTLFYHPNCSPPIRVGSCYVCGSDIVVNEDHYSNSKGLIHSYCAQHFKCQGCQTTQSLLYLTNINDKYYHKNCIKCCICRQAIVEDNLKISSNGFVHEKCIPKIICAMCKLQITGSYQRLGDNPYHQECLVCYTCKMPLTAQIKLDKMGNFYHPTCS